MLPLWSDKLQIVLAPERVTITRQNGGFRASAMTSKTMPCTAPEQGESAWQPAICVLQELLKKTDVTNANADMMLSNHFVRYQLISAQPELTSQEEEQAFVRFSFAEVYGDEVNHWQLRWGSGLQMAPQVASAIDNALIEQIDAILAAAGVKVNSLQPYLMSAFNYVRHFVDNKPHWFVLVEPGSACVGFMHSGDWQLLHSSRLGADWATDLPRVLGREFQMAGPLGERSQMIVCLPGYIDPKRLAPENHALRILTMTPEMLMQGTVQAVAVQLARAQSAVAMGAK